MPAFLPIDHVHFVNRQAVLAGFFGITATYAKSKLSVRQPIGHLASVTGIDDLLINE